MIAEALVAIRQIEDWIVDALRRVTWKCAIFRHYFSVPSSSCPPRTTHSLSPLGPPLRDFYPFPIPIRHPFR